MPAQGSAPPSLSEAEVRREEVEGIVGPSTATPIEAMSLELASTAGRDSPALGNGPSTSGASQETPFPSPLQRVQSDFLPVGMEREVKWDNLTYEAYKRHGLSTMDAPGTPPVERRKRWFLRRWFHALAAQRPESQYWIFTVLILAATLASWMAVLYFVKGKAAAPEGDIFAIICVWLAALLFGAAVSKAVHPLLGAILAGFLLRFIPGVQPQIAISRQTASNVRNMALVVVLLRAGLSLDLSTLGKLPLLCTTMCIVPLAAEAVGVAVIAAGLLRFTWQWSFMVGFLLSAVSPAVVVPILIPLSEKGYGVEKGIPSLVLAVAAVSNVLAIASFYVWHTIVFDKTTLAGSILRAPQELLMGLGTGLALGAIGVFVMPKLKLVTGMETKAEYKQLKARNTADGRHQAYKRTGLLLGLALFGFFGYRRLGFNGSGAMTMFTMGTAVAMGWGHRRSGRVQGHLANIWIYVAQPVLFGIIGSSIDYKLFKPGFLWKAFLTLFTGTAFRIVTTILASFIGNLNLRERMFLAIAWIPKATVQAALAPVVLADVLRTISPDNPRFELYKEWGQHIPGLGILAVLVDAPLGAILVGLTGPKLLAKVPDSEETSSVETNGKAVVTV